MEIPKPGDGAARAARLPQIPTPFMSVALRAVVAGPSLLALQFARDPAFLTAGALQASLHAVASPFGVALDLPRSSNSLLVGVPRSQAEQVAAFSHNSEVSASLPSTARLQLRGIFAGALLRNVGTKQELHLRYTAPKVVAEQAAVLTAAYTHGLPDAIPYGDGLTIRMGLLNTPLGVDEGRAFTAVIDASQSGKLYPLHALQLGVHTPQPYS